MPPDREITHVPKRPRAAPLPPTNHNAPASQRNKRTPRLGKKMANPKIVAYSQRESRTTFLKIYNRIWVQKKCIFELNIHGFFGFQKFWVQTVHIFRISELGSQQSDLVALRKARQSPKFRLKGGIWVTGVLFSLI